MVLWVLEGDTISGGSGAGGSSPRLAAAVAAEQAADAVNAEIRRIAQQLGSAVVPRPAVVVVVLSPVF